MAIRRDPIIQGGNRMIMRVKKISLLLLFFLFVGVSLTSLVVDSHAEENGGMVKTSGVVGFYEDSSSSSSSSDSTTSSQVNKPVGRFPSTGEVAKKSLTVIGSILLLGVVLFFLFKRKKEQSEGGEAK